MNVVVDRTSLFKGLQMVQNLTDTRSTLPLLSHLLVEAEGERLTLTATDLEVGGRVSVPATVNAPGTVALAARKFGEILRELPVASLTLARNDSARVRLRCAGSTYSLTSLAPDDFPAFTLPEAAETLTLDGGILKTLLERTTFAIGNDPSRPALSGLYVTMRHTRLTCVATDGHRLAIAHTDLAAPTPAIQAVVPSKALTELQRLLSPGEPATIGFTASQMSVQLPNYSMTARLLEAQFPNYETVIPGEAPIGITLPREPFIAAIRRVAVMADERTRPVRLTFKEGQLLLSATTSSLGQAQEEMAVAYSGEEATIAFNARYLLDALAPMPSPDIVLRFKHGLAAALLEMPDSAEYRCLIMPIRI